MNVAGISLAEKTKSFVTMPVARISTIGKIKAFPPIFAR
jgi:hypothetical protein